jgi:hypothetical protein
MELLLLIAVWLAAAIGAAVIADSKGRSAFAYFILGFFFPLVGLLIAIGVRSRNRWHLPPSAILCFARIAIDR